MVFTAHMSTGFLIESRGISYSATVLLVYKYKSNSNNKNLDYDNENVVIR